MVRHMVLQFKCNCIACKKNYPTLPYLKQVGDLQCEAILEHAALNIAARDPMMAWAAYRPVIDFLQGNDSYSPCQEIAMCQELYFNMMTALYNKSMHLRFRVLPQDPSKFTWRRLTHFASTFFVILFLLSILLLLLWVLCSKFL